MQLAVPDLEIKPGRPQSLGAGLEPRGLNHVGRTRLKTLTAFDAQCGINLEAQKRRASFGGAALLVDVGLVLLAEILQR